MELEREQTQQLQLPVCAQTDASDKQVRPAITSDKVSLFFYPTEQLDPQLQVLWKSQDLWADCDVHMWEPGLLRGMYGVVDSISICTWTIWQSIGACRGHLVLYQRMEGRTNWSTTPVKHWQQISERMTTGVDYVSQWTLEGFFHAWNGSINNISNLSEVLEQNAWSMLHIGEHGMTVGSLWEAEHSFPVVSPFPRHRKPKKGIWK